MPASRGGTSGDHQAFALLDSLNGSTSLTFTIQNNNIATPLTGVAFSDALPTGLMVSTRTAYRSCGSGAITGTQATKRNQPVGRSLTASASCTFAVM